jgi:hypothetical protein
VNTALITVTNNEFEIIKEQAKVIVESGLLPKSVDTWQKAVTIIMTGRELGLPTMASLRGIDVIQGVPAVKPQAMVALIEQSGLLEDIQIVDDGQKCSVTMKRKGRSPHTESFSMQDAAAMRTTEWDQGQKKTIALSEKYNWKQQPRNMRKWRALAACARVVFPDVILGLYTDDEMGESVTYDEDGVVTGEIVERPALVSTTTASVPEPVATASVAGNGQEPDSTESPAVHWYSDAAIRKNFQMGLKGIYNEFGIGEPDLRRYLGDLEGTQDMHDLMKQFDNGGSALGFIRQRAKAAREVDPTGQETDQALDLTLCAVDGCEELAHHHEPFPELCEKHAQAQADLEAMNAPAVTPAHAKRAKAKEGAK